MKKHTLKITASLVVLVAIILVSGLYTMNLLSTTSKKIDAHISSIENYTTSGNWPMATEELSIVKTKWSSIEKYWTVLIDHLEIDNISFSLARIENLLPTKNTSLILAETAALKQYINHIPEKESFRLKNIL